MIAQRPPQAAAPSAPRRASGDARLGKRAGLAARATGARLAGALAFRPRRQAPSRSARPRAAPKGPPGTAGIRPDEGRRRRQWVPCRATPQSPALPPVLGWRGTRPSQRCQRQRWPRAAGWSQPALERNAPIWRISAARRLAGRAPGAAPAHRAVPAARSARARAALSAIRGRRTAAAIAAASVGWLGCGPTNGLTYGHRHRVQRGPGPSKPDRRARRGQPRRVRLGPPQASPTGPTGADHPVVEVRF